MLSGRQAWQLPSRWRLHSHWHTHVSADLLKGFDSTCPERHGLVMWRWVSSARAGLIRTIGTAHQPVARWRVRTEVFALMIWSRTVCDFLAFVRKKRVHTSQPPESVRMRSANSISKLLRDRDQHRCLLVRNRLYACFGDAQQVGCVAAPSELAVTDLITPVALQNLFTHSLPCGATPLRRRPWPAL